MRTKQISFNDPLFKTQLAFGGTLMKKAKFRTYRPLDRKKPHHMVLRSTQAKREWSFTTTANFKIVNDTLKLCAKKYGVKIIEFAIDGSHIHLFMWLTNRALYNRFVRALTGLIAQKITGSLKTKLKIKIWDYRPFTRIVVGWRGYEIARDYVILNRLEAMGIIDYQKERLKSVYLPFLNTS